MTGWVAAAAFTLGAVVYRAWSRRRVDHRWYCGSVHPANHSCRPTQEYVNTIRDMNADLARADALDSEADLLRRKYGLGRSR